MRKPPLILHLIFHPDSTEARRLARAIHQALNADPAVPGLRIPSLFCPTDGPSPPASYDLDVAEHGLILVLADVHVVDEGSGQGRTWSRFIGDLWAACQGTPYRFLPVQLHPDAWGFDEAGDPAALAQAMQACAQSAVTTDSTALKAGVKK